MTYLRDIMLFIHPSAPCAKGMSCITPSAEVSLR